MRSLRLGALVATVLACLAADSRAAAPADVKIGYIDSARIFEQYKVAQEAQERFNRQVESWRLESAEKEKLVNQLRAEVRDQGPVLSALKRQEKEEALQKAIGDYERFVQEIWGPQGRAAQENESATSEVVAQIRSAVEKIASDKALLLVLDAATGLIVFADRSLDLTADVLGELASRSQTQPSR
jgi:outer membrane protein